VVSAAIAPSAARLQIAASQRTFRRGWPRFLAVGCLDSATVVAGNWGLDIKRLVQALAGDLDWVVIKALGKDRNRPERRIEFMQDKKARIRSPEAIDRAEAPSTAEKTRVAKKVGKSEYACAQHTFLRAATQRSEALETGSNIDCGPIARICGPGVRACTGNLEAVREPAPRAR